MSKKTEILISIISHTNIGKTTLARTLLRKDIGRINDAPHVTSEPERHVYLKGKDDVLWLWDTPGFGHVGKLLTRLEREKGKIGWIMNEVVESFLIEPFTALFRQPEMFVSRPMLFSTR